MRRAHEVLSAVLSRRLPGEGKMRHPGGRRLVQALRVVDVDLDDRAVTVLPASAQDGPAPEGVYAVAWHHGCPVGDLTTFGDLEDLRAGLVEEARRRFAGVVLEHQVRDALATPGGLAVAGTAGWDAVPHPDTPADPAGITVAVCTRDRPDDLRECLEAISRLRGPVEEVLVIDNAPSDQRTRRVCADFPAVRHVVEPRAGLDWARNRALLEATSSVVAFTDDDVVVHADWVVGLRRAFTEEPQAQAVTGLVLPAELCTPAQILFEARGGFGRGYARLWFTPADARGRVAFRRHASIGAAGTGANMAFRREWALGLGGFDVALDVGTPTGGGGDLEMLFRTVVCGGPVVYEPSAVVRHRHRATLAGLVRQRRGDGSGSYSWWLGVSGAYGLRGRVAMVGVAIGWLGRHHARRVALSTVWPAAWPPSLTTAELRGAVSAAGGRLYRRAQQQAAEQAALHPGEPTVQPAPRTAVQASRLHAQEEATTVDLDVDDLAGAGRAAPGESASWLRVDVRRGPSRLGVFTVPNGGSRVSAARLRWEVARRLGPALVTEEAPGRGPMGAARA